MSMISSQAAPDHSENCDAPETAWLEIDAANCPFESYYEPTAEERSEAAQIFAEMGAQSYLDHSETLTLAELVDRQVEFYRGWANPCGDMLAREMESLALKIRLTDAMTPEEYEGRIEVLDDEIRHQWQELGRDESGVNDHPHDAFIGEVVS